MDQNSGLAISNIEQAGYSARTSVAVFQFKCTSFEVQKKIQYHVYISPPPLPQSFEIHYKKLYLLKSQKKACKAFYTIFDAIFPVPCFLFFNAPAFFQAVILPPDDHISLTVCLIYTPVQYKYKPISGTEEEFHRLEMVFLLYGGGPCEEIMPCRPLLQHSVPTMYFF